jgi:hypothetical protein
MSEELTPRQGSSSRQNWTLGIGQRTPRAQITAGHTSQEDSYDSAMSEAGDETLSPDHLTSAQPSYLPSHASSSRRTSRRGHRITRDIREPYTRRRISGLPSMTGALYEDDIPSTAAPPPTVTEAQFQSILQRVVDEGNRAFTTQKAELQQLSDSLRKQQEEMIEHRNALEAVWHGAEGTYGQLNKLKEDIIQELLILKSEQSGQDERVKLLKEQVAGELTTQWQTLTDQLRTSSEVIAQKAEVRIDASAKALTEATKKELEASNAQLNATLATKIEDVKNELQDLHEWAKKEFQDEAEVRQNNEKALLQRIQTAATKRALMGGPPGPLPTTQQRGRQRTTSISPIRPLSPVRFTTRDPKAKEPPIFDGKPEELEEFLSKMDDYLWLRRHSYASEQDKIIHAASFLSKDAYKWWKGVQYLVRPPPGGLVIWEKYEDFKRHLEKAYSNQNEQEEARQELTLEFQQPKDKMIDYISRIRALNLKANLSEDRIWEHLYGSIFPKVREYMKRTRPEFTSTNHPQGLELIYQAIQEAGQAVEREETTEILFKHQQEARRQLADRTKHSSSKPKPSSENPAAPTGINRKQKKARKGSHRAPSTTSAQSSGQSSSPKVNDIPLRIREARKKSGDCIKCGKSGHMLKECRGKVNVEGKAPATTSFPNTNKDKGKGDTKKVAVVQATEGVQYGMIHMDDEMDKDFA